MRNFIDSFFKELGGNVRELMLTKLACLYIFDFNDGYAPFDEVSAFKRISVHQVEYFAHG